MKTKTIIKNDEIQKVKDLLKKGVSLRQIEKETCLTITEIVGIATT